MPILDDFKPDLIINSAGQDNHYTDPITNMNFSARGYADLTALLKPDIAVLEGGYSIEGALPYVNLAIVLALAGIDYSKIKEPDYDPASIQQTPQITDLVKRTCESVLNIWEHRKSIRNQILEKTDPAQRKRNIYYDTDGIRESQYEQIQICPDCAGALRIDSSSDQGSHILAVHIPKKACSRCRQVGYEWFDSADLNQFDKVLLQNRNTDEYIERKV